MNNCSNNIVESIMMDAEYSLRYPYRRLYVRFSDHRFLPWLFKNIIEAGTQYIDFRDVRLISRSGMTMYLKLPYNDGLKMLDVIGYEYDTLEMTLMEGMPMNYDMYRFRDFFEEMFQNLMGLVDALK